MFDYTVTSKKSFEQAVADLKKALIGLKFGVLWELDIVAKMKEKEVEYQGGQFIILEVCNPQRAKSVLDIDIKAGYFLPCKIVVYTKDGITHIGTARPSTLIVLMGNATLSKIAEEVDRDIIAAIDSAI
ncbi:MAG: DUF302 domain-containing protein [Thermovirgaceae bacterium]|nr:DUF302 domain-containing protein [Thermovirgaceae bacterium]